MFGVEQRLAGLPAESPCAVEYWRHSRAERSDPYRALRAVMCQAARQGIRSRILAQLVYLDASASAVARRGETGEECHA